MNPKPRRRLTPEGAYALGSLMVLLVVAGLLWLLCWIWPGLRHSTAFWILGAFVLYGPALLVAVKATFLWLRA